MSSLSQIRILNITEDLGVGTDQVATVDQLSSVGNTIGAQAFVEETNRLYIWNGQGWYNIAVINTTPTWDSGGQPAGSYVLDADSPQDATVIILAASDPEGLPISYTYVTGGQMDSIGTISQDSSVFTITPKTEVQVPDGGTGTITFRASDGVNILPYVSSFTLSFSVDWSSITQQAQIQASNADGYDSFGSSVAISKDENTIVVGAFKDDTGDTNSGSAYVFTKSGSSWSQQVQIQGSDTSGFDEFGESVSVSEDGNTVIVGARGNSASGSFAGSAYVFTRSGSSWSQQAKIQSSDIQAGDRFGNAVSISDDGNTAIIGALNSLSAGGSAYVFTRSGSSWSQQAKLIASDKEDFDQFGWSVSISGSNGNTAIIGAPTEDTNGSNAGAAYIFTRSGSSWSQQAKIQASNASSDDYFGESVSISDDGNTAIIGAPYEDSGGSNAGSVYIFTRSGSTWSQQARMQASDNAANAYFGNSTSISEDGDTVIVGARNANNGAGYAYIFTRSGLSWTQENKIQASNAGSGDEFGFSVAISAETVIVGAHYEDTNGTDAGSAYIFG